MPNMSRLVNHSVTETPLVVVPAQHFDHAVAHNLRVVCVDNRAVG